MRPKPKTIPDEVHSAQTQDGWRIALSRYLPEGESRKRHPVLLVHGLAANHLSFDLLPNRSLARWLRGRGYDIWAVDLRGHGLSEKPVRGGKRFDWCVDDYLEKDLPAAIGLVRSKTGADRVHWIGHSMGGLLLYAYLGAYPGVGGGDLIQSGITVASSLDYSVAPSDYQFFAKIRTVLRHVPSLPLGSLASFFAPLAGYIANPIERFNYWPSNTEPEVARAIYSWGFHAAAPKVLLQLASCFDEGGLRSLTGSRRYLPLLKSVGTPVMALAGDRDRQCAPGASQGTLELLGGEKKFVAFGPDHGQKDHYGHFDLLVGRRADQEVYPVILDWLDRHDG